MRQWGAHNPGDHWKPCLWPGCPCRARPGDRYCAAHYLRALAAIRKRQRAELAADGREGVKSRRYDR